MIKKLNFKDMKNIKLNVSKFLLEKTTQQWLKDNETFHEDICNLINEMMMFEIKYGTKILYSFDKPFKDK